MSKFTFNRLLNYFFRGLLIIAPLALTVYIMVVAIQFLDGLIPVDIPGLGLLNILVIVTLIGYLASSLLTGPVFDFFDTAISKVPVISLIYTSFKDLFGAFVGENKKFKRPVMVTVNKDTNMKKLGFVTQNDLSQIGLDGFVAVYFPHSYNFSGNVFIIPSEHVEPIPNASPTDVMKFIVSGGVSGIKEL